MNWHDEIDDELRRALRREEPPAGFAERVIGRAGQNTERTQSHWWHGLMQFPALRWAATAALVIVIAAGTFEYRHYESERQAGEAAKEQLMLALRITGNKLQYAQQKVNGISSQQYGNATEEKTQ